MNLFDVTFPTPAENLAGDEALLEWCEEDGSDEVLRFWEPRQYFVVVGYSNRVATEVDVAACRVAGIPILRRCSGGGTVLQGPGCLNYALVLRIGESGSLTSITGTNRHILERHQAAIEPVIGAPVQMAGQTDLTVDGRKFSGNSQRRKRRCLLFHGSFLLDLDLARVEQLLRMPSHQPRYRDNRSHTDFLVNLRVPPDQIKEALGSAWSARPAVSTVPGARLAALVAGKYLKDDWNFRH